MMLWGEAGAWPLRDIGVVSCWRESCPSWVVGGRGFPVGRGVFKASRVP